MPVHLAAVARRRVAALHWLCRAVSPLPAASAGLGAPPPESWPLVVALADRHLLLPELALALDRHGLTGHAPPEVAGVLADLHAINRDRNACLREQMLELTQGLATDGIAPIWLKGAAELLDPGWERSGRMMNDLDVWIPDPAQQTLALARLERLGYRVMPGEDDAAWASTHHFAGRVNDAWPVRVELHHRVIMPASQALLPDAGALRDAEWLDWRGFRVGRLDGHHRVLHAMVQATAMAVPVMESGRTPLMKALDVVRRVAANLGGGVPDGLRAELARPAWAGMAPALLTLTERLFALPNPLPDDPSLVRRVESITAYPRLNVIHHLAARTFTRRFLQKLARPASIPGSVDRYVRALLTGRDTQD